jgi:Uncharacterised nucleotidyltransferase
MAITRPEEEFLLRCARACVGTASVERVVEPLRQVADWEYVFQLASRHGLAPLISRLLNQIDASELPRPLLAQLLRASRDRAARSLELTAGLFRLLDLFDLNRIPAVAFKGPVLASSLYGNVGLREFCDLDVLIRREDALRAKEVLLAHGYRTDLPTTSAREAAYLRARHELHFTPEDGDFGIEIHQAFVAPYHCFPFDYDSLWFRLQRARVCGREIPTLAPEDLLLVLCVHGTKHMWSRLGWLCDIARLLVVSGPQLDWCCVLQRAQALGVSRMLSVAVLLSTRVLGAPTPAEIGRRAEEDASALHVAQRVVSALFENEGGNETFREHMFFLKSRERLRDKFLYCSRLAFTPTEEDHSVRHLPAFLAPLHYPFHAIRVAGKYGLASIRSGL